MKPQFPRGIAPGLLVSQVYNTAPYLFIPDSKALSTSLQNCRPVQILREYSPETELDHFQYYQLCLASHYLSCATPVPTDVDNQIRNKLWPATLPTDLALAMADLVLESHEWDLTGVSRRFLSGAKASPCENQLLSGHQGEWFTVACAAYCALERMAQTQVGEPSLNSNLERIQTARSRIFEMIQDEIHRHSEIFGSLWAANDGIGCLKASAIIAHNLGDLDRVMDLWDLSAGDPLRLQFYKLGSQPLDGKKKLRYKGRLWISGQLYASRFSTTPRAELPTAMAFENHRHFALRKPKCLRTTPECLIPFGPFLDPWGTEVATQVANASGQPSEDTHEVIQALLHGWERLPHTVGYGRALRAMGEKHPELPIRDWAKSHPKAKILEIPQSEFESQCALSALEIMEEIPGRM